MVGKRVRESGVNVYTLPYFKQIPNEDLLYSAGNADQNSVTT